MQRQLECLLVVENELKELRKFLKEREVILKRSNGE